MTMVADGTRVAAEPLGVGRALVVGTGVTGRAVVTALRTARVGVVVVDDDPERLVGLPDDVEALVVDDPRPLLERVDVVLPSPGVPEHAPLLRAAAELGMPVWSEPELAGRLHPDRHVVGITGTNGKTSVTELVTAMLVTGGVAARVCGNIGTPVVEAAASPGDDVLVAELSSFQLRFVTRLRCRVGTVLNLAPDHLDWHGDLAAYGAAKARVWAGQHEEDWAVVPAGDPTVASLAVAAPGPVARLSGTAPVACGVGVEDGWFVARGIGHDGRLLRVADLAVDAPHMRANVAASAAVALLAGADPAGVTDAAAGFRPGRHRGEQVAVVDGVTYLDDSKATNPHAAAAALSGGDVTRTVWIGGGLAKGVDLGVLAPALRGLRHAVLVGAAAPVLAAVCGDVGVTATVIEEGRDGDPMGRAVAAAASVARSGDRVLLSPACASFDLFDGYADRGDRFAAAVRDGVPPADRGGATGRGGRR